MPKCAGHVHDEEGTPVPCGGELRNQGFRRGDDGEMIEDNYVCGRETCSLCGEVQSLPTSTIKEGN